MSLVTLDPGGWPGHPYAVNLGSSLPPEALFARLDPELAVEALWGTWFGGGVAVFVDPLVRVAVVDAAEAYRWLDRLPDLTPGEGSGFTGLGGGWLVGLGYAPGHSSLAFYDSLLRWQPEIGWRFESLGLRGRESADCAARVRWASVLSRPAKRIHRPEGKVTFSTRQPAEAARDHYLAGVEATIGRIRAGDFYQLNLCTRLHGAGRVEPASWFGRLAARLQPAYGALLDGRGPSGSARSLVSLSPELFLRVRGRDVWTSPIKGTAPRIRGEADSPALRASAKDAAENVMIVDLMRNDLSRVCEVGSVEVTDLLALQPHPGVWHLVSTVHGRLVPATTHADLLAATFPPGSVTGAPKSAAIRGIDDLEPESRGAYTGALGLISPCAGAELSVVIRTFEVAGEDLSLGVGGGLTADSVPIREWYECLHKARPLVEAAGADLDPALGADPAYEPQVVATGVFESILVVDGRPLRLDGHLARLDSSCRELYGAGLPSGLADLLLATAAGGASIRAALRITVRPVHRDHATELEVTHRLSSLGPRLRSSGLVEQDRPRRSWRHKWLDRTGLAVAEEQAAPDLPYFTARHERVSETSRGNLFLRDPSGCWRTPPLDEAVLPGVTRRAVLDLLDDWGLPVRVDACPVSELRAATAVFWTSSLSGAVVVEHVDGHPVPAERVLLDQLNRGLGHQD